MMDTGTKEELLKSYRLRSTPSRQAILDLFVSKDYALSHSDIEQEIDETLDRVTVYRTLKTFLDKGLIHKVLDNEGTPKYALCTSTCSESEHHHDHIHFKCKVCGETQCLTMAAPEIKLPNGFVVEEVNFLVQGVCVGCSSKKSKQDDFI